MALLKTISGIRGTIGGKPGQNLTPLDIVECTAGFGMWIKSTGANPLVVVGRDGRLSGEIVSSLAVNTLISMGINVIDTGFSTTPTVEIMVSELNAGAGIIFTASHNPKEWNALKFLNQKGEFISSDDGQKIVDIINNRDIYFNDIEQLGSYSLYSDSIPFHINKILQYPLVDVENIRKSQFSVVVDCINSTGALAIPPLLDALGVTYTLLNKDNFGHFAHNPEPLPKHLSELSDSVVSQKADLGISVDPDVDRLAFVCEDGAMFGEEYTLVAIADYVLSKTKGNTVSNLSSTRALRDVTRKHGGSYSASAVGEVNVVNEMKNVDAVIGGEGNGGIIIPDLHYGRDALIGIALFLSLVAERKTSLTSLKASYPTYEIIKDKIDLISDDDLDIKFEKIKSTFKNEKLNDIDGLKIDFDEGWVHMRKSNTEPIVRIYAEANEIAIAQKLIQKVKEAI